MKTIGKIFIILVAFVVVMGITYVVVNASETSTEMTQFENGERPQFSDDESSSFEDERTEFPGGDFDGQLEGRHERGVGGWMFGLIKNIGIVAIVTVLIALPRTLLRNRKRSAPAATE